MLSTFLFASLAMGGEAHASLHPADADFYLELPDLVAARDAYAQAPLVRFLQDQDLGRLVAGFVGADPEAFRLDQELLRQAGTVLEGAGPTAKALVTALEGVRALSLSSAALGRGVEERSALLAVECAGPEAAASVASAVRELFPGFEDARLPERRVERIPLENPALGPDAAAWLEQRGSMLLLGLGRELAHTRAEAARLAGLERFQTGRKLFADEPGPVLYEIYVDVDDVWSSFQSLGLPLGEAESALRVVVELLFPEGSFARHQETRLCAGRFVSRSLRGRAPRGEAQPASAGESERAGDLARLPHDAIGVWSFQLSPARIAATIESALGVEEGGERRAAFDELKQRHGFDPIDGLLQMLGTRCTIYSHPVAGLALPRLYALLELRDAAGFERGLAALATIAQELGGEDLKVGTRPYRNFPLVSFGPRENPAELLGRLGALEGAAAVLPGLVPSEIALTVIEGRGLVGLGEMGLKREIRRLIGDEPSTPHALAGEAYAIPSEATALSYFDWGALLKGIYETLRAFAPLIAQVGELSVDPSALPDGALLARHFRPTFAFTRELPAGRFVRKESSFGPEVPIGLVLLGLGIASADELSLGSGADGAVTGQVEVRSLELEQGAPAAPAPEKAADPVELTRRHMRLLRLALNVHKADRGLYPAQLADLLEATDGYPNGFLEEDGALRDGWNRVFRYETLEEGKSYRLWSNGPDGVDDGGAGDDLLPR